MPSGHLSRAELAYLVDGMDGLGEAFTSFLHLKECRRCRSRLVTDFPDDGPELVYEFNLEGWEGPGRAATFDYSTTGPWIDASKGVATELYEAPALSQELACIDPARQRLALEARRFHKLGFASHLLSQSSRLWHESPPESCRLARLALIVVSKLEARDYPSGLTADVRCRTLAYLGNGLRLTGRLHEAESKLTDSLKDWEQGTGDPRLRARLLSIFAQLHRDQRRFPEALEKARHARELYRKSGDVRRLAWLFVIEASILCTEGDTTRAIEVLQMVLGSFSRTEMGEAIYWATRQNLCHSFVEADRLWDARRELTEVKRWARQTGGPLIAARIQWVEALLMGCEGDTRGAALRLERVRDAFLSYGLPYDAALACLDLAALYLRRGDVEAARELAGVLAPVFRASVIDREALASLHLLANALGKETATAAQVEALSQHLTHYRRQR